MQKLKKIVKKGSLPIQQIVNRLNEKDHYQNTFEIPKFSSFLSLSTRYLNNYCIADDKIIKVTEIKNDIVTGEVLTNTEDFFFYPLKSSYCNICTITRV